MHQLQNEIVLQIESKLLLILGMLLPVLFPNVFSLFYIMTLVFRSAVTTIQHILHTNLNANLYQFMNRTIIAEFNLRKKKSIEKAGYLHP
jgi:hypothetical protein